MNSPPSSKIEHRERAHHADQRKRARNRVRLQHQVDGADHRDRREDQKEERVHVILSEGHQQAVIEQVDHRDREHEGPGEAHELVIAEARQRGANPDKDEQDRRRPSATNQNSGSRICCNGRNQEHARHAQKEHAEHRERDAVERPRGIEPRERSRSGR